MNTTFGASRWILTLALLVWSASAAEGSSLTLDTAPGNNAFNADDYLIAGATVNDVALQEAGFEAFHWWDKNNDGVWNGPDARRHAIGTYANGLFGFYSSCLSLGAFSAAYQTVATRGILLVDDLMITTDDPSSPATLQTSLSLHVSGATSHFTNPNKGEALGASMDMRITINGSVFVGEYTWSKYRTDESETVTGLGTQIAGGGFSDSFSATIITGLANVPVNAPFRLEVQIVVSARAGGGASGSYGGVTFDARNTAGFLPGAPIFNNLPAGYTAHSQDAGIVNNAFSGTPVATEEQSWGGIKALFDRDTP